VRHHEIQQQHIRLELFRQPDRFVAVCGIADDLKGRLSLQEYTQRLPEEPLVISNQQPNAFFFERITDQGHQHLDWDCVLGVWVFAPAVPELRGQK
jgi:hypothetical protein